MADAERLKRFVLYGRGGSSPSWATRRMLEGDYISFGETKHLLHLLVVNGTLAVMVHALR